MRTLEFHLFCLGAYPYVPPVEDMGTSIFIDTPTEYFDPLRGQRTVKDFIDTLVLAEEWGFDGAMTAEQHGGPSGTTGQATILATWVAARTNRILIGAVGPILPFYANPVRYAEEIATLDQLSGGRAIMGLPMGIGANWHLNATTNPAYARERMSEAHDLVMKAFTEDRPFAWEGNHFNVPYVNLWPKPLQRPTPPVFVPAAGSKESLKLCADNDYTYQAVLVPKATLQRNCDTFRDLRAAAGRPEDPSRIAAVLNVHVAETDEQARREVAPFVAWHYQNGMGSTFADSFPPGHVSVESLRGMRLGGGYRSRDISTMTLDDVEAENWLVVGSPDTVRQRIDEIMGGLGAGRLIVMADFFIMPAWLIRKSMMLFAEKVIPHFREPGAKAVWAKHDAPGYTTLAEYGDRVAPPRAEPAARLMDGRRVNPLNYVP